MISQATLQAIAPIGSLIFAACFHTPGALSASNQPASLSQAVAQNSTGSTNQGSMDMSLGPKDATFDLRFLDGMTPHHQGAVTMAQEALQKSRRPEIKQLAQAIIAAQNKEITQMQAWRAAWYPTASAKPVMYDARMKMDMPMTAAMLSSMAMNSNLGAADDQFDLRFINAMLTHHQGAVTMAQEALEKSDRPAIKQLAQAIIRSQGQEISQLQQWRKAWYGQ